MVESSPHNSAPAGQTMVGVIGLFDTPEQLLATACKVRDAGYRHWDCHTPYPVHGLDAAMGLRESPIPYFTIGAGFVGGGVAMLMQWWMNAVDYPLHVGGKPLFTWPAFVPITFELFVLFAALATTVALVVACKLWRWHSPLHDSGVMAEVTTTRFAVGLMATDPKFDWDGAEALLEEQGCEDLRPLFEDVDDGRIL